MRYHRMVKRDARFLSPQAQAELRQRVINAVSGGMTQAAAARVFGVSRWSVVQWVGAQRSHGAKALLAKPRGRRVGEVSAIGILEPLRDRRIGATA
jgi:transposase